MRKYYFIILFIIVSSINLIAQQPRKPEVGKPMPNFILDDVEQFKNKKVSLEDFKGKWLFLDFWFTGCSACINSFPKVNDYHKEFKDKLNWILVGLNDVKWNHGIKQLYEKLRIKNNYEMPSAYDSILVKQWEIGSMPHIIIVDPSGVVRFITGGRDMTKEKIRDLLDGKEVKFYRKDIVRPKFNPNNFSDRETAKKIKEKLLYSSILTRWNGEEQHAGYEVDEYVNENVYLQEDFKCAMVPLEALYKYAYIGRWGWDHHNPSYYGKFYPKIVLSILDSSLFQYDYQFDVGKGTYNYSLTIPDKDISKTKIMTLMQEDLKRVFNYNAVIETRKMNVWKLIAKPGVVSKLKTKGETRFATSGSQEAGFILKNWPKEYLVASVSFYIKDKYDEPFVDDTGLNENFDFSLRADMTDIEDIRKELRKQGLDLVKGTRDMKVLVISDSKPESSTK